MSLHPSASLTHSLPIRFLLALLISLCLLPLPLKAQTGPQLPTLTDRGAAALSAESEYRLGRNWARILRGRAPIMQDPLTWHYLDELLWDLVPGSQLTDRRLELIVLDNPTFNAFAVPGGIVGIHGGLVVAAETEDELASVITHELAHLSQRHFAQRLEEERRNRPLVLAGVLASILIASADTQGGAAALSSTMAASAQAQLAFSRRNEEEADRVGMHNLVASGRDPHAMPDMFARLQRSYRFYGQRPPEFLLTHPVTESRIADSMNRAATLPRPSQRRTAVEFELIRTRLQVHYGGQPGEALQQFLADSRSGAHPRHHYGVMVAALRSGDYALAHQHHQRLPDEWRQHLYTRLTQVELLLAERKLEQAQALSQELMSLYPDSFPVLRMHAQVQQERREARDAAALYRRILEQAPTDTYSWYQLAEVEGLAGNILAVHEARIEYFLLTGSFDHALRQVDFALRERGLSPMDEARLQQRREDVLEIRRQVKEDL